MRTSRPDVRIDRQSRTRRMGWLNLTEMRRCLIYRPLAILMSLLLLPGVSWVVDSRGGPRPFQATAQIISGCTADPSSKSIIRKFCVTTAAGGTIDYHDAPGRLESDAVNLYLSEHGLPASDAPVSPDGNVPDPASLENRTSLVDRPAIRRNLSTGTPLQTVGV